MSRPASADRRIIASCVRGVVRYGVAMRRPILVMVLNGGLSCRIGSRIGGAINFGAISEVPPSLPPTTSRARDNNGKRL